LAGAEGQGTGQVRSPDRGTLPGRGDGYLGGSATLRLERGGVEGVNLKQALRRSERRPLDAARDMRVGATAFNRLSLEFALGKGVVHVVNGDLVAQGVVADLQGAIDLAGQSWKLRVNATQTDGTGEESRDTAHLNLATEGSWSQQTIRAADALDASPTVADPPPAPPQ